MLIRGTELLETANEHDFAIPAFNISDHAMFNGIVDISEQLDAPLIVAIHPDELAHTGADVVEAYRARANRSRVPITIHLDHGSDEPHVLAAIAAGFTSVMIDGSLKPFEDNVAITRRVVEVAHAVGVQVEGELGTIGNDSPDSHYTSAETIMYTDPDEAVTFVEQTGVDSLAIAIGTSHGLYPADMTPELRLDLLKDIKSAVGIPLVLHGGSGNPDGEIGESVTLGINKINISSDIKSAYHDRMREVLADPGVREPLKVQPACVEAMQEVAAHKIRLFGAEGMAKHYR